MALAVVPLVSCSHKSATVTPSASPSASQPVAPSEKSFSRLVDVGGYRLHIKCEGSGASTVVLIHGFDNTLSVWRRVQDEAARFTRVCSYSRAGLGRSDKRPGDSKMDGVDLADELHTLLARSGVAPPYVSAGHSFGGAIAHLFAARYRREVRGVVLLDPVPANFLTVPRERLYAIAGESRVKRLLRYGVREDGSRIDVTRLGRQLLAARSLGSLPAVLVTRGKTPPESTPAFEQLWNALQRQEGRLSSNEEHVVAARSGHDIPADEPDLVIRAIRAVVTSATTNAPLPPCRRLFGPLGGTCV